MNDSVAQDTVKPLLESVETSNAEPSPDLESFEADVNAPNGNDDEWGSHAPGDDIEQSSLDFNNNHAPNNVEKHSRPSLNTDIAGSAIQQLQHPLPLDQQPLDEQSHPTDSLSLSQLKKLVTDMPKVEATSVAFRYQDASCFGEEIEEWFDYSVEDRAMLQQAESFFAQRWEVFNRCQGFRDKAYVEGKLNWCSANDELRHEFLKDIKARLESAIQDAMTADLMCLVYITLGLWVETAGVTSVSLGNYGRIKGNQPRIEDIGFKYEKSICQIQAIRQSVYLVRDIVGFQLIFNITRRYCERECNSSDVDVVNSKARPSLSAEDVCYRRWSSLTILYMALEVARQEILLGNLASLQQSIIHLQPNILTYLTSLVARLRWEEPISLPLPKILLLYWKSILVIFGGIEEVARAKADLSSVCPATTKEDETQSITASPLDYHLFRQEVTSKYPAFNPPLPSFAFEPETNSILPPLQKQGSIPGRSLWYDQKAYPSAMDGSSTSILHQPVHIATPAPSPPPSPAGPGGKLGKKQNYQTNQMFPFLYPPLVPSSNNLGGKGTTEIQDLLVGRQWEGSDIPTSILEAADLFSKRTRTTRAMRQLWNERIRFMKYERGYDGINLKSETNSHGENDTDGSRKDAEDMTRLHSESRRRLLAVEEFYNFVLPDLQSVIIVLLKVLLMTVTNLVTQGSSQDALGAGFQSPETSNAPRNGPAEVGVNNRGGDDDSSESALRELDTMRSQEIMGKALSAILFLLLKWFKLSHILKAEYLSQLLLDSNYIQLTLKLFTHQELEKAVIYKCERKDLSFFYFCQAYSGHVKSIGSSKITETDDDDAVPPPIRLHNERKSSPKAQMHTRIPLSADDTLAVDFSWRNFFSSINYLRIVQKVCKHKAHRNLLMVQHKYSNILKKSLKVPQQDIRLYTLKIIKGQVPYCNRKWRAANMRTLTAIYLHCRPELRDDWLAGVDVDAEIMDALPQEQAIRALTYWYNIKNHPDKMGIEKGLLEKEQDFFLKELDALGSEADPSEADREDEEHRWEQVEGWQ